MAVSTLAPAQKLGPWSGVYRPGYDVRIYKNGDPSQPLTGVNLRTCTRVWTQKSIDDVSGQFQITLKDRRAQSKVAPMDVVVIRLQGHNQGWGKVLVGVVDEIEPTGTAQVTSAQADVTISGRCTGKYLQSNSMFLPVWDPLANLPTALIFGMGDASNKLGTGVNAYLPRTIFGYIFDHFVVGERNRVGLSGTPNARFWMSRTNRFEYVRNAAGSLFQIPFVQFDENTCDSALTQLVVQGFTEGWVDEVGNVVYRPPQWDAPISWTLHTDGLKDWDLPSSDVAMATYVECYPGALPALPSGTAQAMLAGRAPIPSDYVTGLQASGFTGVASPEFIIDTDKTGKVTSRGAQNWYYQKQKKYGLRPYQITSPLLADRQQAQAQAEGLLRFMLRYDKSGTFDIPGEPNVRLGQTILLHGRLEDQAIYRTYYVQAISHEYVESDHYTTTLTLTHGRDPGDPSWQQMVLPNYSAAALAQASGILTTPAPSSSSGTARSSSLSLPSPAAATVDPTSIPYLGTTLPPIATMVKYFGAQGDASYQTEVSDFAGTGLSVQVNKVLASNVQAIGEQIKQASLGSYVKDIGGFRTSIGGSGSPIPFSMHQFGAAIDINEGSQNWHTMSMDPAIVAIFARNSWYWGGNWGSVSRDGGHFQFTGG